MNEKIVQFEKKKERFPIEREVREFVTRLAESRECNLTEDPVFDEKGLSQLSIVTTDAAGDRLDISYTRDRDRRGESTPRIHETLYVGEVPVSIGRQFDYLDGEWIEVPS